MDVTKKIPKEALSVAFQSLLFTLGGLLNLFGLDLWDWRF